jgi:hypothetical protein
MSSSEHPRGPSGVIPFDALFGEGVETSPELPIHPHEMLRQADVILGVDVMSRREFLLYGRETLEQIAETGQPETIGIVRVELDQESEELEKIAALWEELKGPPE